MTGKPEIDIWSEARDLLLRWESLTLELGKSVAGGETPSLLPLLRERRKLGDQLDALRKDHGIASWVAWPVEDCPTAAQEEVKVILSRLLVEDRVVRNELQEKMRSLNQKITEVRQTRMANRLYQQKRHSINETLIDTRR